MHILCWTTLVHDILKHQYMLNAHTKKTFFHKETAVLCTTNIHKTIGFFSSCEKGCPGRFTLTSHINHITFRMLGMYWKYKLSQFLLIKANSSEEETQRHIECISLKLFFVQWFGVFSLWKCIFASWTALVFFTPKKSSSSIRPIIYG